MKLRITVEGVAYEVEVEVLDDAGIGASPVASIAPASSKAARSATAPAPAKPARGPAAAPTAADAKECKAPIAGNVVQVKVKPGDTVTANQVLLVMEAMKMETNIPSPTNGKVKSVKVKAGQAVKAGELLVEFE